MSVSKIRSYTDEVSPKLSTKLNKDDSDRYTKLDRKNFMKSEPYTNSYGQLRKWGSGRGALPVERTQLVDWCQMISPENIYEK